MPAGTRPRRRPLAAARAPRPQPRSPVPARCRETHFGGTRNGHTGPRRQPPIVRHARGPRVRPIPRGGPTMINPLLLCQRRGIRPCQPRDAARLTSVPLRTPRPRTVGVRVNCRRSRPTVAPTGDASPHSRPVSCRFRRFQNQPMSARDERPLPPMAPPGRPPRTSPPKGPSHEPTDLRAVRIIHDERAEQLRRAAGQSRLYAEQRQRRRQPQFRRR